VLAFAAVPPSKLPAPGQLLKATVKTVTNYGAFFAIEGYKDGLCHVSQLDPSGGRVAAAEGFVAVGDRATVRVLDVSEGKVALTLRGVEQPADAPQLLRHFTPKEKLGQPPDAKALEQLPCVSLAYSRSGGAGGQNVNKLSTKCEARLSVSRSPWPEAVKARLLSSGAASERGGDVIVTSDRHRTQAANRQDALEKLATIVANAWFPPKERRQRSNAPSFKGKAARRDQKQRTSEKKRSRASNKRGSFDFGGARRSVLAHSIAAAASATLASCWTGAGLASLRGPSLAMAASALTKEDVSITRLLPDDKTLYKYDPAPLRTLALPCVNVPGSTACSLSDLAAGGTKYVVLWFFPEDRGALNLEATNNAKEVSARIRERARERAQRASPASEPANKRARERTRERAYAVRAHGCARPRGSPLIHCIPMVFASRCYAGRRSTSSAAWTSSPSWTAWWWGSPG
jgi:predicted RNA-binding protein with RPS1 domain